jgi:hypothetical protein
MKRQDRLPISWLQQRTAVESQGLDRFLGQTAQEKIVGKALGTKLAPKSLQGRAYIARRAWFVSIVNSANRNLSTPLP